MSQLSDYKVSFPYGATDWPYSSADPHHGDDIAAPAYTPIVVSGKQIGLVGSTGLSTGPHCHIDKNRQLWVYENFVRPTNYYSLKGEVIFAGDAGTAGNTVIIETDDGWFYRYLHMSRITCKVGDIIGEDMLTALQYNQLKRFYHGSSPTATQLKAYVGKITVEELTVRLKASTLYKTRIAQAKAGTLKTQNHLPEELRTVYKPPASVDVTSNDAQVRQSLKDKISNFIKGA